MSREQLLRAGCRIEETGAGLRIKTPAGRSFVVSALSVLRPSDIARR